MRLYAVVAVLTFLGSFAVYSATQMSGVANAIGAGGTGNGMSYAALFRNFNPLTLLQRERVLAAVSSSEGIPRMEPFRSNFDASAAWRSIQPPKITIDTRRAWGASYYQPPRVPQFHTTPVYRPYR